MARFKYTVDENTEKLKKAAKRGKGAVLTMKKPPMPLLCIECKSVLLDQNSLDEHMKTHAKPLFFCPRCIIASYDEQKHLDLHLNHCPFTKPFRRKRPPIVKIEKPAVALKIEEPETLIIPLPDFVAPPVIPFITYPCRECPKTFRHKRSCDRHIAKSHAANADPPPEPKESFQSQTMEPC